MSLFVGYLCRWSEAEGRVELRFVSEWGSGAGEAEVTYVSATRLINHQQVMAQLKNLDESECAYVPEIVESGDFIIGFDYSEPLALQGGIIQVRQCPFELEDKERFLSNLATQLDSLNKGMRVQTDKLNSVTSMICEQINRIDVKAAGHESGSTARTLYDQQAHFLHRLLDRIKKNDAA